MAFVTADRTADTTTTVGTFPFVVSGTAPVGSRTFSAAMSVGDTCYYSAQHRTLNEWEVGLGTYSSANTLTRTTIYSSSNAGSAVNFSAGTKDVFITMAAARSLQLDSSGNVTPSFGGGTYTRTTFTSTAGQTSFTASYTVGYVQVYVNGILLNSADYTATTGSTVVLASPAATGDIVDVIALNIGTFTSGGYTRTTYTGTAGQTSFTASYTPGYIQVYLNGVLLDPTDYTASSGSVVVLNTGTAAGDTVDLVALTIAGYSGGYNRTSITATAGQTSFTATYSVNYVQVYLNGMLLNATDYTATTGTSVVLAVAASAGDLVDVVGFTVGSVTGAVTITGTPASGQLTSWSGSTSVQGFAPSATGDVPFSTDGTTFAATQKIVRGTTVTLTTQTSVDFTSIPSWVKRITMMFSGMSTNGTSLPQIQLGAGSVTTTGYLSSSAFISNASNTTGQATATTGFVINQNGATLVSQGSIIFSSMGSNLWVAQGVLYQSTATTYTIFISGSITLSGTLDRVRLTTVNGTDTFDAGSVNILYE